MITGKDRNDGWDPKVPRPTDLDHMAPAPGAGVITSAQARGVVGYGAIGLVIGLVLGALIALAVFAGLIWAICKTTDLSVAVTPTRALTVRQIGEALMTDYVWPLQCVGVLLTAALIGALVLVMEERR